MEVKTVELLNELNELRKARGMCEMYLTAGVDTYEDTGEPFIGYELKYANISGLVDEKTVQEQMEKEIKITKIAPF